MSGTGRLVLAPLIATLVACAPGARPVERVSPTPTATLTAVALARTPAATRTATATAQVSAKPTGSAKVVTILIGDDYFAPVQVTVTVGTTVTWVDYGRNPHTATAHDGAFTSPALSYGGTWTYTFTTPGRHSYICLFHPDHMLGDLAVVD